MNAVPPVDLLLRGAMVRTLDPAAPVAEAVAVSGGRVVAVGSGDEVAALAGPATTIVDLGGGLLLPGFQDAHAHPVMGGVERGQCDLTGREDLDGYLDEVRRYAEAHPEREWVLGGGWQMSAFPGGAPRREDLDRVVPGRPVALANRDHHGMWVSSRALELAGVDATTPDPRHGRVERDPDGTPSGTLHEGASSLVTRLLPTASDADLTAALLRGQAYLHSLGITAWQDAIVGRYLGHDDTLQVYRQAAVDGLLTARVVGALWWDRKRGVEQVADLVERRNDGATDGFAPTSVKIMADGICENFSAAMTDPYLDPAGGDLGRGHGFLEADALREAVVALDAAGFQVHVHAIGDRAVHDTLDAFAAARAAHGRNDLRHHVAHIQVVRPDDVGRFAALDVVANAQPLWACEDAQMRELTLPFLGPERSRWQYPFGGIAAAGGRLAMGSDWPVSSPDPLLGMHVAVNRRPPDDDTTEAFLPEQSLDLATALHAYTAGSAWVNHLDDTGRVAPGYRADLVLLDRDVVAGPAAEIADARVLGTWVGGRQVHGA